MIVFHVDANSAYLSWTAVALLEKGFKFDLRNIPSAIAGDPKSRHGIILTKSIPAKKYGIKTGESLFEARKKCPDLVVFPPDYDLYMLCSEAMYQILCEYSPCIQRYSVDECFCDMTGSAKAIKDPIALAKEIKERIKDNLGFTVNIGIGANKLCAKMAGELKKPDMIHTLWPKEIKDKMWTLPVEKLFYVGKYTAKILKQQLNITTIGQLAKADPLLLKAFLKSQGILIHNYANGIDDTSIIANSNIQQKGVGNGTTYAYDLRSLDEIYLELLALCERVSSRLRKLNKYASLVSVHLRSFNLSSYSHQVKIATSINTTEEVYYLAKKLLNEMWHGEPIRAMSVSLSELNDGDEIQLSMFDYQNKSKNEKLDQVIDQIRENFGENSIYRGAFINSDIKPMQGGVNDCNYLMMGGYKL